MKIFKKIRALLSVALCLCMVAVSVGSAVAAVENERFQFDYATYYGTPTFNVFTGDDQTTTAGGWGYLSWLKTGSAGSETYYPITPDSTGECTVNGANAKITITADCSIDNAIQVSYTVTNLSSSQPLTFSLGSVGQMGSYSSHTGTITPLVSNKGLQLSVPHEKLYLWLDGSEVSGFNYCQASVAGDVDDVKAFLREKAFASGDNTGTLTVSSSANYAIVSWHWDDTVPAGGAKTYSVMFYYGKASTYSNNVFKNEIYLTSRPNDTAAYTVYVNGTQLDSSQFEITTESNKAFYLKISDASIVDGNSKITVEVTMDDGSTKTLAVLNNLEKPAKPAKATISFSYVDQDGAAVPGLSRGAVELSGGPHDMAQYALTAPEGYTYQGVEPAQVTVGDDGKANATTVVFTYAKNQVNPDPNEPVDPNTPSGNTGGNAGGNEGENANSTIAEGADAAPASVPKTGDSFPLSLYLVMLLCSVSLWMIARRRMRKSC